MVMYINGESVSELSLEDIPKVIERAKRPLTIKFERCKVDISFLDVVCDQRKVNYILFYIIYIILVIIYYIASLVYALFSESI